jgi:preprotein translocase SecF subunit
MFNLVQRRRVFFTLSLIVIGIGLLSMLYSLVTTGQLLRLGNDFVGGSIYEVQFGGPGADEDSIRDVFAAYGDSGASVQRIGEAERNRWSIRAGFHDIEVTDQIIRDLGTLAPLDAENVNTQQVSATVGQEVTQAAVLAVLFATLVVTGFIVIAFRQVPNALRYGVCAILAMFHDVAIIFSIMSIMGLLLGWEVNALFLTAVLTVVGFSVQDTIVLFDRIRENIPRYLGEPFETIVNRSILETIHRSLATQLNAFFIIIAILLFGGESIKPFIAMLFIGLLTGTYSSIFVAVPLLVNWQKGEFPFTFARRQPAVQAAEAAS